MRLSGEEFSKAVILGLTAAGVNVIDIGLVSTDTLYFAAATLEVDGGIQITASHNPKEWGGLKMVREKGGPISGDTGIYEIRDMVVAGLDIKAEVIGSVTEQNITEAYFEHVLKTFDVKTFKPLKIVANANYGMANLALPYLSKALPINILHTVNGELNGNFPKGPSDPLLVSNRTETIEAIKNLHPDFGVAWDGDADRAFFFDENGQFVHPAYISSLLAKYYLQKYPGGKILHDTRIVRVIDETVKNNGGIIVMNKAGHSFIKERMIKDDIVFGCETSGHYYFKDNFYLDNGIVPFLAVLDMLSQDSRPFSEILKPLRDKFYMSEEINFEYQNPNILQDILAQFKDAKVDNIDGYDFNYPDWRFNLRFSNTQNLLRLNLEANSKELLEQKTQEVTNLLLRG